MVDIGSIEKLRKRRIDVSTCLSSVGDMRLRIVGKVEDLLLPSLGTVIVFPVRSTIPVL